MIMNISEYNDSELSDMVDNDEYLYNIAMFATDFEELKHAVVECFVFNNAQMVELEQDFAEGRWA